MHLIELTAKSNYRAHSVDIRNQTIVQPQLTTVYRSTKTCQQRFNFANFLRSLAINAEYSSYP